MPTPKPPTTAGYWTIRIVLALVSLGVTWLAMLQGLCLAIPAAAICLLVACFIEMCFATIKAEETNRKGD